MWYPVFKVFLTLGSAIIVVAYPLRHEEQINRIDGPKVLPGPYVVARNATYYGTGPRQEARAMCSVNTHEVNATANATITRRLYGVVTPRDLNKAVQRIENQISNQVNMLWQSLDSLRIQMQECQMFPSQRTSAVKPEDNQYWRGYQLHKPLGNMSKQYWVRYQMPT